MDLAATFYVSIYGLAAVSSGVLAWAEQGPSVTMLTAPLAICALLLNERYRVLRLDSLGSGVAGILATVYPAVEFMAGNEESPLLAATHLLSILQCILLFHNKVAYQYWWIFATSCLQIALAAVLTSAPMFGLLILLYMFWALWALSVFTLLMGRLKYGRPDAELSGNDSWVWPQLNESGDEFDQPDSTGSQLLDGSSLEAAFANSRSSYRSSVQCDPHETDIGWRFVCGVGLLSSSALLLGLVFFLLTPRLWIGTSSTFQDVSVEGLGRSLQGFSEKVQLSDFGRILESSAPVLELSLKDERSGQPVNLLEFLKELEQPEPYLRGTVLESYHKGEWLAQSRSSTIGLQSITPLGQRGRPYIRQTIRLEAIGTRTLFSLADPHYGIMEDQQVGGIKVAHATEALQFAPFTGPFHGAIRYHLMIPKRTQRTAFPQYHVRMDIPGRVAEPARIRNPQTGQMESDARRYLEIPDNLAMVQQTAASLAARASEGAVPDARPARIARALVAYLRDSGQFGYSLEQKTFDSSIDPIEDFLINRKSGHCQYFATALALLLRSAGIPSRIVTGFKGGIEYPEEGRLEVQQRHAHAWVEAYIDDDWVTLDATPPSREDSVDAIGSRTGWFHGVFTFFSGIWSDYVVNLSFNKQQRDLYAPFQFFGQAVAAEFQGKSTLWARIRQTAVGFFQNPREWFSITGGVTAFLLMLTLLGLYHLLCGAFRRVRRLILGARPDVRRGVRIDFYEQFLKAVKPLGLVPLPQQTQLEFAQQVEADWLNRNYPAEFLPVIQEICAAFYRLRFGDLPLTPEQDTGIRSSLQRLEAQVRRSPT